MVRPAVDEGDATSNYAVSLSPSGVTPTADLTVSLQHVRMGLRRLDRTTRRQVWDADVHAGRRLAVRRSLVSTTEDTLDEGTGETFTVTISSPSGGGGPAAEP